MDQIALMDDIVLTNAQLVSMAHALTTAITECNTTNAEPFHDALILFSCMLKNNSSDLCNVWERLHNMINHTDIIKCVV